MQIISDIRNICHVKDDSDHITTVIFDASMDLSKRLSIFRFIAEEIEKSIKLANAQPKEPIKPIEDTSCAETV